MNVFLEIMGNVGISIVASAFFWYFSFVITGAKIIFSGTIEKQRSNSKQGECSYRIRLTNYGARDFTEVTLITKILITTHSETKRSTYLATGDDQTIPIMGGWRSRTKERYMYYTYFPGLYMCDKTFKEFEHEKYTDEIRKKAKEKTLTLSDIFEEYGENVELTVYIFGNDAVTGARKMFTSKRYTLKDVEEGRFVEWQKENHFSLPVHRKKHIENLLSKIE